MEFNARAASFGATSTGGATAAAPAAPAPVRALLVLNVQNDYFTGGSFPVRGADAALVTINGLRSRRFDVVFVCSTHRPPNFLGYSSNNPGTRLHEAAVLDMGPQLMWPDHCVEGTFGANFHPDLAIEPSDVLTSTGHDPHSVVHSAFGAAHRQGTRSLLEQLLRRRNVAELYLAGLTTDYGILYTALDSRLLLPHVKVSAPPAGARCQPLPLHLASPRRRCMSSRTLAPASVPAASPTPTASLPASVWSWYRRAALPSPPCRKWSWRARWTEKDTSRSRLRTCWRSWEAGLTSCLNHVRDRRKAVACHVLVCVAAGCVSVVTLWHWRGECLAILILPLPVADSLAINC